MQKKMSSTRRSQRSEALLTKQIEPLMTVAHLAESRDDSSGRSQMNQIMERNERSVSKKRPTTPSFSETAPKSTRKRKNQ